MYGLPTGVRGMKYAWLAWLPMLFLPNVGGIGGPTAFGSLDLSDYLIVPFVVMVTLDGGLRRGRLLVDRTAPLFFCFVFWALFSTLLIRERFDYPGDQQVIFGALKLGKLSLYGLAGLLVARALRDDYTRRLFLWSLLAAGVVNAVALTSFQPGQTGSSAAGQRILVEGYKANNAVSAMMAVLITYLGSVLLTGQGSHFWRIAAGPGIAVMGLGFLISKGRGGWAAALVGAAYLFHRRGLSLRTLTGVCLVVLLLAVAYLEVPDFQAEVDRTLWPDQLYLQRYQAGIAGFDDGVRWVCWTNEAAKLVHDPLLGTGFFHRGGKTALWIDGSHNFFLQMFLETGVVGGLLVLATGLQMWRQAGSAAILAPGLVTSLRAALLAAWVGGMSGEYFYGGTGLLVLLLVYAPVGSFALPATNPNLPPEPRAVRRKRSFRPPSAQPVTSGDET